ncbi:MAG: AraC family transcriptional regulator [Verrucomicrobiota bacterium]
MSSGTKTLFGNQSNSPIRAEHLLPECEAHVELSKGHICMLLSRSGQGETSYEGNTLTSGKGHEGIAILFERSVFVQLLDPFRPGLRPSIRAILSGESDHSVFDPTLPPHVTEQLLSDFFSPQVAKPALPFYLEAKIKEFIALSCFGEGDVDGEFFCTRQKRLSMDRISKAIQYLKSNLDEPLDLALVAKEAGCSSYYLSRTFSAATGMTISQYFRKCRIEKAAELIVTGRYNIGEAAIEVGYNSLSHFSKAFQQEKGCLPSRYRAA